MNKYVTNGTVHRFAKNILEKIKETVSQMLTQNANTSYLLVDWSFSISAPCGYV